MEHGVLCYEVRDKGTADRPGPQLLQKPRQIAGERPRRKSELLRAAGKAVQAGAAAVCPGQLTESGQRQALAVMCYEHCEACRAAVPFVML